MLHDLAKLAIACALIAILLAAERWATLIEPERRTRRRCVFAAIATSMTVTIYVIAALLGLPVS